MATQNPICFTRRHVLLALAVAPVGCTIQPLAPLATHTMGITPGRTDVSPTQVGQAWTYRQLNHFNGQLLAEVRETVATVDQRVVVERQAGNLALPAEHHGPWGQLLRDPVWDYPLNLEHAVPLWPTALIPGQVQRVDTHFKEDGGSYRSWVQVYSVVKGWERVTVAAGTPNKGTNTLRWAP